MRGCRNTALALFLCVLAGHIVSALRLGLPSLARTTTSHSVRSRVSSTLFAKKKSLMSEDLYASLSNYVDDDDDSLPSKGGPAKAVSKAPPHHQAQQQAKKNHNHNKFMSDELLDALVDFDDDPPVISKRDKKEEKKRNREAAQPAQHEGEDRRAPKQNHMVHQGSDLEDEEALPTEVAASKEPIASEPKDQQPKQRHSKWYKETNDKEHKAEKQQAKAEKRKDKPSGRIRFSTDGTQPDFVSMGLDKVSLVFGNEVVLKDATMSVSTGERVGLVGPNGGGKSTQLKILAGELEPTTGSVTQSSSNLRVAYLRQEFIEHIVLTRTLKEELMSSFTEEQAILEDIAQCEKELEATTDTGKMDAVLERLQELQELAQESKCYALEPRVLKVMDSMGFTVEDGNALVGSFSGGWKMRIGLAKILLLDPNILLLDEPTNHMDLDSVIWLEEFLQKQNIPMVVVSHDREFLDRVCNKIVDVEDGVTVSYLGNYSRFLEQRKARLLQWRDKYEKQQRFMRDEEKYIKKAHGDPSLHQVAKSREAALEKLRKGPDLIAPPPRDRKFRFRFPPAPRCGETVLVAENLKHGYGDGKFKTLFEDVAVQVKRGDRVGFIGPNGAGKSTMMRILMGHEEPQEGFAEFATNSVHPGYYAQNQADTLNLNLTVLETVQQSAQPDVSYMDICALLSQFMFKGDDLYKQVGVLSGGEKARVALCKMMLEPANLLFLDEPTNHLDITSKEVLEEALRHFAGSVVLISHDRYFMSQVANTIFSFHNRTVERHDCDYHDFLERQLRLQQARDEILHAAETLSALQALQSELSSAANALAAAEDQQGSPDNSDALEVGLLSSLNTLSLFDESTLPRDIFNLAERLYDQVESTDQGSSLSLKISSVREVRKKTTDVSLKEKVASRHVSGDKYKISKAKEVLVQFGDDELKKKKKNFGGSGVTCGNLHKGIKNAKRFMEKPGK